MSLEQCPVEIPGFPEDPGDGLIPALIDHVEVGPGSDNAGVTLKVGKLVFERGEVMYKDTLNYDKYEAAGKQSMAEAIRKERVDGLGAALPYYEEAAVKFIGAIGSNDDLDPVLLIQYADCLTKQVKSGQVKSYGPDDNNLRHHNTRYHDRSEDLQMIALNTYDLAWSIIKNDTNNPKPKVIKPEEILQAAIGSSEGLLNMGESTAAKDVLRDARFMLATHDDTDPELVECIDKYAMTSENDRPVPRKQVVAEARLGLATDDRHDLLQLV